MKEAVAPLFPSDEFLKQYYQTFISEIVAESPATHFTQAEAETWAMSFIREEFDEIFMYGQRIRMRHADRYESHFEPLYLFRERKCVDWVKDVLIERQWWSELSDTAQSELFDEFIKILESDVLHKDVWWSWFCDSDSVWVHINEHAKPNGQNRPRRKLEDLFGR